MSKKEMITQAQQEQYLYNILRQSKVISDLTKENCHIHNFQVIRKNARIYFNFDIVNSSEIKNEILYKVEGSVLTDFRSSNYVYTITNIKGLGLSTLYVDSYTNISVNLILNELTYINTVRQLSRATHVSLTIKKFPEYQNEIFIIDPDSDIYKLYSSRQIDAITLANLVLFQEHKQKTTETSNFTKKIGKKFI